VFNPPKPHYNPSYKVLHGSSSHEESFTKEQEVHQSETNYTSLPKDQDLIILEGHTEPLNSPVANQTFTETPVQSDPFSTLYNKDPTPPISPNKSNHSDNSDKSHNTQSEGSVASGHSEQTEHSDQSEHSDKSTHSKHSDKTEYSEHSDNSEKSTQSKHSGKSEKLVHSDKSSKSDSSIHSEYESPHSGMIIFLLSF